MLFSLLFNVRLLASELHIHPSGMRDKRLERAACPTGGVELLACGLGTFRLGTLRLGTLRLGTLRLGTLRLGTLRLGTPRLSCLFLSCIYTQAECGTGGSSEPPVPMEVWSCLLVG